tara:strand:+ start:1857 stop:2144 length:288 start_codon:yes stop_codon:yes gene_type:complete
VYFNSEHCGEKLESSDRTIQGCQTASSACLAWPWGVDLDSLDSDSGRVIQAETKPVQAPSSASTAMQHRDDGWEVQKKARRRDGEETRCRRRRLT